MKKSFKPFKQSCFTIILAACIILLGASNIHAQQIKNVVLVHGAFADASGYKAVYDILTKKGYHVTMVQNSLTSLEDDVTATNVILDKQDGPTVLVGHSWGGVVITEAGNHPKVASLVYISSVQPDSGETGLQWLQSAPPAPEDGVLPPDDKGILYYDAAKFHAGFCADLPKDVSDFMCASQGAFYLKCLITPVKKAAWHTKPSFACIGTEDKTILPSIQRTMYKRANTKIKEIKGGSHVVFMSQPQAVAQVIEEASKVKVKQ